MAAITSLSSEASTNKYTVVITNAGFAGKEDDFKTLVTAIFNKIDTVITDVNTHKTQEEIEDIVGAMFDGGTETRVSATYDDTSGKINLVVDDMSGDNNTTYSISCVDGDNSDEEKIRLTAGGSGSGTDDVVLEAGTGLSIARDGDKITFTNTVTDNDTTYSAGTNLSLAGTTFNLADASLLTKGAAAFHQDYFSASSGTISIKSEGIDTDEIKGRAVTYAKMQNVTDARMLGNNSGSAASPTEMSKTDVLSFLNVADGANANVSGDSGNAAIYDNSGTPTLKTGISQAEMQTAIGGVYTDTTYTAQIGGNLNLIGTTFSIADAYLKNNADDEMDGALTVNSHILAKTIVYFDAETANTIGNGATGVIDWTVNQKQKVTITGTSITCNFTNPPGPCNLLLKVIQGDGSDVIGTWDSDIKWPTNGTAPTLSTGNGDIDILSFYFDGTNYFGVASLDFA